ncbi:hypothetical protein QQS21_003238 [Conoideocrella luteorostrata]|uniref:Rhodopsin domain-containing protein n=1 Tax=Conoideocrella luteorostrata TaxID=1105319 RepID=A0AAJ0CTJ4_9HYPO|nr:hypothetical protein QQS21_003238 [Conoideocrella luteorostrata]
MLPPDVEIAPVGGDVDRGPRALILFWVTTGVSIVIIALRFLGRYMRKRTGLDDWMMLITVIHYILFVAILTKVIALGGLRHLFYLTPQERVKAVKWTWICQPFVIMGFATGKLSVGILLYRVIGSTTFWRKWSLCFTVVSALVFSIVNVALTFAQCSPPSALWNPHLVETGEAKCWPPSIQTNFAIFVSVWNILTDLFLALLPATFLYNLDLTLTKKLGLCVLLGLGITAAVFASVKTMFLTSLNERSDITWETYNLYVWSGLELFVIIVCGSVPPIKPVYDHFFGKPEVSTANATGYGRYGSDFSYPNSEPRSRRVTDLSKTPDDDQVELSMSPIRSDAVSTHSTTDSLQPRRDDKYSPH